MFHQTFSSNLLERKLLVFRESNSKPKIRIEKGKLPQNFFKPLRIVTSEGEGHNNKEPASTPYFGSHQQAQKRFILSNAIQRISHTKERKQFHQWFRKNKKSLSSRVQTVPAEISQPKPTKRHASERKTRMQRIRSVRQEQDNKPVFRIFKRYEHLIRGEAPQLQSESYNKLRIKPSISQDAQKVYKNGFKAKRGYAETKYKQSKALNSISTDKQTTSLTLPLISNG